MAAYLVDHNLDMVIGSRFIEKKGFQSSYTRRMGIKFFTGLIKLMTGKTITDPTSGLRMIGRMQWDCLRMIIREIIRSRKV